MMQPAVVKRKPTHFLVARQEQHHYFRFYVSSEPPAIGSLHEKDGLRFKVVAAKRINKLFLPEAEEFNAKLPECVAESGLNENTRLFGYMNFLLEKNREGGFDLNANYYYPKAYPEYNKRGIKAFSGLGYLLEILAIQKILETHSELYPITHVCAYGNLYKERRIQLEAAGFKPDENGVYRAPVNDWINALAKSLRANYKKKLLAMKAGKS